MKILMTLLAMILLFIGSSCKKQVSPEINSTPAAPPLNYVILDKNGKNILDTLALAKDSVTLTCNVNGVKTQFCDSIFYGFKRYNDINQYNNIVAWDFKMLQLSVGIESPYPLQTTSPVHTFSLSYHGNFLGTIYFESLRWNFNQNTSWQEAKVFTFNNMPVKLDSTANGTHFYIIQLQ
jgi:hypothetical protein